MTADKILYKLAPIEGLLPGNPELPTKNAQYNKIAVVQAYTQAAGSCSNSRGGFANPPLLSPDLSLGYVLGDIEPPRLQCSRRPDPRSHPVAHWCGAPCVCAGGMTC